MYKYKHQKCIVIELLNVFIVVLLRIIVVVFFVFSLCQLVVCGLCSRLYLQVKSVAKIEKSCTDHYKMLIGFKIFWHKK